jgi:hypothetical protein
MNPGRVLLTFAVLAFAFVAGANSLDRVSGDTATVERLVPAPFRAEAHRSAAEIDLGQLEFEPALADARKAVARDPIDPDSTALLGTALLLSGNAEEAERAFRIAARFGWRNFATQAYWFDAALSVGDFAVAADRADALLRAHPQLANEAEFLRPFEESAEGRQVLAERLQSRPPWLSNYLDMTRTISAETVERHYAVLQEAASGENAITCADIAGMTRALLEHGLRGEAESLWNGFCPDRKVAGPIADPVFARVLPGADELFPFAWRLHSSGDLSVRQAEAGGGLVVSLGGPGTRLVLSQAVSLAPGRYRFRAATEPAGGRNSGRLALSWACEAPPPFPRQTEGELQGEGQLLTIGACDRQRLGIWLSGRGPVQLRAMRFERLGG